MWWHPILHFLGIDNVSGYAYGFWSGFGSDLGEIALVGAVIGIYRKHNCHVKGCWRIGKHPVDSTPFVVCRKHHPDIDQAPTAEDVKKAAQ